MNTILRKWSQLIITMAAATAILSSPASALVVENMTGTTSAPADDPGWDYVTQVGSRNFVYLRDGWALSAFHVGLPDLESDPFDNLEDPNNDDELIQFPTGSFLRIKNQAFTVKNPAGSGLTSDTDLRLIRINGDPGLSPINIGSQQLFESTPIAQREVVIIGNGPSRQASQSHWDVEVVPNSPVPPNPPPPNDIWTEVPSGGDHTGYSALQPNVKRWGTNQIADEDCLFNGNCNGDNDLRGTLNLTLGVGPRDIMSMVTQFDMSGLTNEAQVVSGDSGSGVFYKRNGVWELIGIVNAQYSTYENQSKANAVYGNYTTFADLSYYRNEILNIMSANPNYSVMGDINLDGILSGGTVGGVPTGDIAAFVAGWGNDNGDGVGDINTWKKGDLNRDGKTDVADFLLLRSALNATSGGASLTLDSLFGFAGVPEPSSLLLTLAGVAWFTVCRRHRR